MIYKKYHDHGPDNKIWYWIWQNIAEMPPFLVSRWQLYRLRYLLIQHYLYNPFYHSLLEEIQLAVRDLERLTMKDLPKLPIMTKSALQVLPLEQCSARNIPLWRRRERSTSGSTGNPFRFWVDNKYNLCEEKKSSKLWRRQGFEEKIRMVVVHVILPPEKIRSALTHKLYLSGLDLYKEDKAKEIIKNILEFGGQAIMSFPSFLVEFCNLLRTLYPNLKRPLFEIALTAAETLDIDAREFIEENLGCKIFDRYCATEFFCMGYECQEHDGFHLNVESHILEVVDGTGEPVPHGEGGRVVVTNLDNEIMPFIRYDTGDLGHIMPERCPCGNSAPRLKVIGRRNIPKIWIVQGRKINPFLFYEVFMDQSGVVQRYQIRKKSDEHIQILIVPGMNFTSSILDELRAKAMRALGVENIKIDIVTVQKIPPGSHGKRQDFVDEEEQQ